MKLLSLFVLAATLVIPVVHAQSSSGFELPVQLLGFPVIIIAVRIANFLKKLSYALNPRTYKSRSRRGVDQNDVSLDPAEVEKRLVKEMGPRVCVYEDICIRYANPASRTDHINWDELFKNYGSWPNNNADYYLLSVFMGDIVGSPTLCKQLAKRGRSCYYRSRIGSLSPVTSSSYLLAPTSAATSSYPSVLLSNAAS